MRLAPQAGGWDTKGLTAAWHADGTRRSRRGTGEALAWPGCRPPKKETREAQAKALPAKFGVADKTHPAPKPPPAAGRRLAGHRIRMSLTARAAHFPW